MSLENVLRSIVSDLHFRRAVLMFPDFNKRRIITAATIGVPRGYKEPELKGDSGSGYLDLEEDHPVFVARRVGLPFHTCLNEQYQAEEFSKENGEHKRKYYTRLQRELQHFRRQRYTILLRKGLLPEDYDKENIDSRFLAEQNVNFSRLWEENWCFEKIYSSFEHWDATDEKEKRLSYNLLKTRGKVKGSYESWRNRKQRQRRKEYHQLRILNPQFRDLFPSYEQYIEVKPQVIIRYGVSEEQYCNTLMLGVYKDKELIAVAQFDSPIEIEDFTTPLSREQQLAAQAKLQKYVPAILLEGVLLKLGQKDAAGAERDLGLILKEPNDELEATLFLRYEADANGGIFFPNPELTEKPEGAPPLRNFCIKRSGEAWLARAEAYTREQVQHLLRRRTFQTIGTTEYFLISEIEPCFRLSDLLRYLGEGREEQEITKEVLKYCIALVEEHQSLLPEAIAELPFHPQPYQQKLEHSLQRIFPEYPVEQVCAIAERITEGMPSDTRQFDRSFENIAVSIELFSHALNIPAARIAQLKNMVLEERAEYLKQFFEREVRPVLLNGKYSVGEILDASMITDDYDKVVRGTFTSDDYVQLIDHPLMRISFEERNIFFGDKRNDRERVYRNLRWADHLMDKVNKGKDQEFYRSLMRGRLLVAGYCASVLGERELHEMIKTSVY